MGCINLYKIDTEKKQLFFQELAHKMAIQDTLFREKENTRHEPMRYGITLYISRPNAEKEIAWNWVLEEFNQDPIEIQSMPKGVIVIECGDETTYAVTFGHAYFLVDKFCNREFLMKKLKRQH